MRRPGRGQKPNEPARGERGTRREPHFEERRTRFEKPERRETANAVYGVLPVLETLRADSRRVDRILIAEGGHERRLDEVFQLARAADILIDRVSRETITRLTGPDVNHQGIAAVVSAASYVPLEEILDADPSLLVILDGVEDPRNFGAILRTAECAGADGVIIPERRAVGLTDTVVKSSAGATEHIKVTKVANLNRLIDDLKQRNIWVVGTSGDAATGYTDWDWKQPSALVLGSEGAGLHRLVSENCDVLVKIPMYGKIGSLNVSVAAGVVLFEAMRQRGGDK